MTVTTPEQTWHAANPLAETAAPDPVGEST